MADVDIVARFALKTQEFVADTNRVFGEVTGKARSTGGQIRSALGGAFRDVADDAVSTIPVIGSELTLLNGKLAAAALGVAAFGLAFTKGLQEAEAFGKSVRQLDGVLTATGNKTGFLRDQLVAFAEEAEGRLAIPAEDILKTQAALATFDGVAGPIFQRTIEAAADIAAVFGGDLSSNAEKLGTVLQNLSTGNVEGLARGFKFLGTETIDLIENLAETGKTAQAQERLLAELEARIGGQGEAAAGGLTGAVFRLRDAWGDMLRQLGEGEGGDAAIELLGKLEGMIAKTGRELQVLLVGFNALTDGDFGGAASALGDILSGKAAAEGVPGRKLPKGGRGRGGSADGFAGGTRAPAVKQATDTAEATRKLRAVERERSAALREAESAREKALEKELRLLQRQAAAVQDLVDTAARLRGSFGEDFEQSLRQQGAAFRQESSIFDAGGPDELKSIVERRIGEALSDTADEFGEQGIIAAQAIAQAFGGSVGGQVARIAGVLRGLSTGDFTSVGGSAGGILTLLSGGQGSGFDLSKVLGPKASQALSQFTAAAGPALAGYAIGQEINRAIGTDNILGQLFGVGGGVLGKALGLNDARKSSVTLGGAGGRISVGGPVGNSRTTQRNAATGLGGSLQEQLQALVDQLGGSVGSFAVSIGARDNKFAVDPTGRGNTGRKYGATQFDTAEEAIAFALADAVRDGAVAGVSQTIQNALRGAASVEQGLANALTIKGIADQLKALDDPLGFAIEELGDKYEKLAETFRAAGATAEELAGLERLYAEERKQVVEASLATLRDFQTSLGAGSGSPLSLTDQRRNAEAAFAGFERDILAGKNFDQQGFVQAGQTLLDIERQINGGTAGFFDTFNRVQGLTGRAIGNLENVSAIREGPFAQRTAEASRQTADSAAAIVNGQNTLIQQNAQILAALQASGFGGFVGADGAGRGFVRAA
jgi:hypothetical protein